MANKHDVIIIGGGPAGLSASIYTLRSRLDALLVELYYNHKRQQGYTEDQIQRKRLSLEGKLVPVTAAWNEELLRLAGFRYVDCFWRCLNFAGWVAWKE